MTWRQAPATAVLALVTLGASLLIFATGGLEWAAIQLGFVPLRVVADVAGFVVPVALTPLTATLVHGGIAHIAFNLVILAFCGREVERVTGTSGFLMLYIVGAFAAAAGHWLFATASPVPMVGASGAISAVVGAYSLYFGERRTRNVGPISANVLHVLWLAAAWIGIQLLIGVAGLAGFGAIAIGAHIGGFLAGLALARPLLLWRYRGA